MADLTKTVGRIQVFTEDEDAIPGILARHELYEGYNIRGHEYVPRMSDRETERILRKAAEQYGILETPEGRSRCHFWGPSIPAGGFLTMYIHSQDRDVLRQNLRLRIDDNLYHAELKSVRESGRRGDTDGVAFGVDFMTNQPVFREPNYLPASELPKPEPVRTGLLARIFG